LRDMSVASLELLAGVTLLAGGALFGGYHWASAIATGIPTPVGTIMLAVLPIMIGVQLLLAFLAYDFSSVPRRPIGSDLEMPETLDLANSSDQSKQSGKGGVPGTSVAPCDSSRT
jgi:hypothetical protein